MRFSGISILVVLVIFLFNDSANGIVSKVLGGVNEKVIQTAIGVLCDKSTKITEKVVDAFLKVFGNKFKIIPCGQDESHEYCTCMKYSNLTN